jgi:hypothetical protein
MKFIMQSVSGETVFLQTKWTCHNVTNFYYCTTPISLFDLLVVLEVNVTKYQSRINVIDELDLFLACFAVLVEMYRLRS